MSTAADAITVRMTDPEREAFERLIRGVTYYLEFGCGGSTELAVINDVRRIVSVESDPDWVKKLSEKRLIRGAIEAGRVQFEPVDIGPVGGWGMPKDLSGVKRWPQYALRPFAKYDYPYDVILIDGRFRNLCAYVCWAMMLESTRLVVHDYTLRGGYSEIEKFFEMVDIVDTLAIFKRKKEVVPRTVVTALLQAVMAP